MAGYRIDVRPITLEGNRAIVFTINRKIGERTVRSLVPSDVRRLIADLTVSGGRPGKGGKPRPLGADTVRKALNTLTRMLDLAVEDELVPKNAARGIKPPRQTRHVGKDLEHWSPEQMLEFRQVADAEEWAAAWRLSAVGLRRSEVLGLRWSDVDLDAGTVSINQGRVQLQYDAQRSHFDAPKSSASRRTIPVEVMAPGTVALLRGLRNRQAEDRFAAGEAWTESGLLLVDALGQGSGRNAIATGS